MATDKPITLPIRPEIQERHAQAMAAFGQPGTWLDAETRTNILKESRQAPHCALCDESRNALSPYAVTGEHDVVTNLPKSLAEVVHRLRTDSGRLTETWLNRVLASGISAGAYIETVGLVATGIIIDSYSHAVGAPQTECPNAVAGEPSREANPNVFDGGAWLPMLDVVQEETNVGLPSSPNIFRAMGLVPSAIDHFFSVMRAHYSLQSMSFLLSRSQTEMIASRVSALNQCYYWTTSHTMLLRRSGASQDQDYNLSGLTADQATIGVDSEEVLLAIAGAVVGFDHDSIGELVNNQPTIDPQFISDAIAVASGFNGITKIANATGLPLDDTTDAQTVEMREDTGINKFSEKIKKKAYG